MVVAAVVVALALGVAWFTRGEDSPPPRPDIPLDAWAPYWTLDDTLRVDADPDLAQRLGSMREVSPFWYTATAADRIEVDPNASVPATEAFLDVARSSDVAVVPSIVDTLPPGGMAAILADPDRRRVHVETIVDFVAEGDFDGIDIDYEQFAFADGRDTWEATRPNWVAFVAELGAALDVDGKSLTVSIPPVYDDGRTASSGFWVYDYGAIAPHVDRIRIMAYDFSVGEPGPIAPLSFVERAIEGALEATGAPEKLVLGVPAYGRDWPVAASGECPETEVDGVVGVNARSVDDLLARRDATPVFDEATGEWSFGYELEVSDGLTTCVQTRQVHYVDGDGVRLRMDLAREYRLDGVALWALGFDDAAVWDEILPTVAD